MTQFRNFLKLLEEPTAAFHSDELAALPCQSAEKDCKKKQDLNIESAGIELLEEEEKSLPHSYKKLLFFLQQGRYRPFTVMKVNCSTYSHFCLKQYYQHSRVEVLVSARCWFLFGSFPFKSHSREDPRA